jgi:hypothetical protein
MGRGNLLRRSLFFTSAAFLTYREAVDAGPQAPHTARRRFFVFQPRRIDWWTTAVQLAGAIYFNISTGNAMRVNLAAQVANQRVWRPDAIGSICFLVASTLAWFEACASSPERCCSYPNAPRKSAPQ